MFLRKILLGIISFTLCQVVVASPTPAIEIAPFNSIYSRNINGNFVMAGNTLQTCSSSLGDYAPQCRGARNFEAGSVANNDFYVMRNLHGSMANIDSDELFNSSTGQVQLPRSSRVQKAFLFWFGDLETPSQSEYGIAPENESLKSSVLFSAPGDDCSGSRSSQCKVEGKVFTESLGGNQDGYYTGFADVTDRLDGVVWTEINDIQSAIFSVGNVQTAQGLGTSAGWSLVVLYVHPDEEIRHINVNSGFGFIAPRSSQHINVRGIDLPKSGDVETSIGVFGADGDLQTLGDSLTLASGTSSTVVSNLTNPANNIMNSSVTQNGVQSSYLNGAYTSRAKNTFGVDVDRFYVINALPRDATSVRASFTSTGDSYFVSALILSTPVNGADVHVRKYISTIVQGGSGSNSVVTAGDTIDYSIEIDNRGSGSAKNISLTDGLDSQHLRNLSTMTPGCSISGTSLICANLGLLNPGDPVKTVRVTAEVLPGTGSISNFATVRYNSSSDITSNTVTVEYGKNPIDLGLSLIFNPEFIQASESSGLHVTVSNFGPADESNPVVKIILPTGITAKTSWPAGCSLSGKLLTCGSAAFGISGVAKLEPGSVVTLDIELLSTFGPSKYLVSGDVFTSSPDGDPNLDNNTAQTLLKSNHAPIAKPARIQAIQNGPIVTLDIAKYIADRDGDSLRLSYVAPAAVFGVIRLSATTFSFKPNESWSGNFRFTYRVNDGRGGTATSTITVHVEPNDNQGESPRRPCRGLIRSGC